MSTIQIKIDDKTFPAKNPVGQFHQVISHFHLAVNQHEFICLVGPSGCGKSTLLNIIAGLDPNFSGIISFDHQPELPKIGYVFQNPRLLPWHTVRKNIELAVDPSISSKQLDSLFETMQLTAIQQDYPDHLSLGMSRRVAIIRAFAINPDLLLMDEPFVSLDAPTARQVRALLLQLWQQRPHTVLFVTHDLREAIALADRLVFLSSSPMRLITEIRVPIPRNQRNDENEIESFRKQLLNHYPEIKQLL